MLLDTIGVNDDDCLILAIAGTAVTNMQQKFKEEKRHIQASTIAKYLYLPQTIYKFTPIQNNHSGSYDSFMKPEDVLLYLKHTINLKLNHFQIIRQAYQRDKTNKEAKNLNLQKALIELRDILYNDYNLSITFDVKFKFVKEDRFERCLIIDEAGMVSQQDMERLLELQIPIIMCGDKYQLGPVNTTGKPQYGQNIYIKDSSYRFNNELTKIMRQGDISPVLQLANDIRHKNPLTQTYRNNKNSNGHVTVMTANEAQQQANAGGNFWQSLMLLAAVKAPLGDFMMVCHQNDFVTGLNIQAHLQFQNQRQLGNDVLHEGEPILLTHNCRTNLELTNGTTGLVQKIHHRDKFYIIADILINGELYEDVALNTYQLFNPRIGPNMNPLTSKKPALNSYYQQYEAQFNQQEIITYKKNVLNKSNDILTHDKNLDDAQYFLFITYGFAMTIHKSQGKEWENVVLLSTTPAHKWTSPQFDSQQLHYTAVTRAKSVLNIVDSSLTHQFFGWLLYKKK